MFSRLLPYRYSHLSCTYLQNLSCPILDDDGMEKSAFSLEPVSTFSSAISISITKLNTPY